MSALADLALAIVGPGRVGQALGRRFAEAGVPFRGFLGRTIQSAGAAVRFAGAGKVLDASELAGVPVVLLAVRDDELGATAQALAARATSGLWVHCSGGHGLDVLDPLAAAGATVASFHPLSPFPDPELGYRELAGKPVLIETRPGAREAAAALEALARAAGLQPVVATGGDRLLYHAACVLAANGLTALHHLVTGLLRRAMPQADVAALPGALMGGALSACEEHGAVAALSGPVVRGDASLLQRQAGALRALDPAAADVFTALLRAAAAMAAQRGSLSAEGLARVLAALDRG